MHYTTQIATLSAVLLTLAACGRPSETADVKMVGVGVDPDEVGPAPTPYGGIVEYAHVDMAGAGLNLGLMGLSGTDPIGPDMNAFEPPYEAVMGFSYIFDQKLAAADTMVTIGGAPPAVEGTCYTAFEPSGPIGSFTTVDVGDYMRFETADKSHSFSMARFPTDYPPDPQDMFVYYIGLQYHTPFPLTHLVPDPANPVDPREMVERVYRPANYPFGQEITYSFPGGFARADQPVGSIPRASSDNTLTLPEALNGVVLEWDGPLYDGNGEQIAADGTHQRCFEFFEGRDYSSGATLNDCDDVALPPRNSDDFDTFVGQMYTAPWETDGGLTFNWHPTETADDLISISVRFMAPIDEEDADFHTVAVEDGDGNLRPAQACDPDKTSMFDEDAYKEGGEFTPAASGDSQSQMITVNCLLPDDGTFTLEKRFFERALAHTDGEDVEVGGVVFFFTRATALDATFPDAKDRYEEKHEINPVKITATTHRVGRFWWN